MVRGRSLAPFDAAGLESLAAHHREVEIELGAGDGRRAYRLAREDPGLLVIAVDPNAAGLREISFRAGRKPARGGLPNLVFIRGSLAELPGPLERMADRITVEFPWGSLLEDLLQPRPEALRGLAGLAKAGASLRVAVNAGAIADRFGGGVERGELVLKYRAAGLEVTVEWRRVAASSSWAKQLSKTGPLQALVIEGKKNAARAEEGPGSESV